MGRIKTQLIKRSGLKFYRLYREHFTDSFDKNKVIINEKIQLNKKIRNPIVGYITRLKKQQEQGKIIR